MNYTLFSTPINALLAVLFGIVFGFLLRKATASRFDTIVGQLLLRDYTVMKVILTAIVIGSIGIYSLDAIGLIPTFHLSETSVLFSLIGGSVFGIGMSVAGYCPGTGIAAIADGSKDMLFGVVGMILGSVIFNHFSPTLMPYIGQKDFAFKHTIHTLFEIPSWVVIVAIACIWGAFVILVRKYERKNLLSA